MTTRSVRNRIMVGASLAGALAQGSDRIMVGASLAGALGWGGASLRAPWPKGQPVSW